MDLPALLSVAGEMFPRDPNAKTAHKLKPGQVVRRKRPRLAPGSDSRMKKWA